VGRWSASLKVTVISVPVSARRAHAVVFSVNKDCYKAVRVLPGEKPSLLVLRHQEPCRDQQFPGTQQCRRGDAAAGIVEGRKDFASSGTDPKGANFGNGFLFGIRPPAPPALLWLL